MIPLGHIVVMVSLDLEFVEDSLKIYIFEKGGQTVLCVDAGRFLIRAYIHCHKLYNQKRQGWSDAGPYELYILQCDLLEMVRGSVSSRRNMFHKKPNNTVDNYFFTDAILDWDGNAGLGIIGTNASNMLPKDIEPFYPHK